MDFLIAISHFVGVMVVQSGIAVGLFLLDAWHKQSRVRALERDFSLKLAIPLREINHEKWEQVVLKEMNERFSNELLRNRVSDLFGVLVFIWGWFSAIALFAIYIYIAWVTYSRGLENAIWVWSVVVLGLFATGVTVVLSLICRVLTGRYPSQARQVRKGLFQFAEGRQD